METMVVNFTEALHAPTEAVLGYGRSRGKYRMKSDVGLRPLNVRIYIYIYQQRFVLR